MIRGIEQSRVQLRATTLATKPPRNHWVVPVKPSITLEEIETLWHVHKDSPESNMPVYIEYPMLRSLFETIQFPPQESMLVFARSGSPAVFVVMTSTKPMLSPKEQELAKQCDSEEPQTTPWWTHWTEDDALTNTLANIATQEGLDHSPAYIGVFMYA